MISLGACNPFVRVAMIQDAVMEGDRPRIAYDNRLFFICNGKGTIILNGTEIEIGENSLIYLGIRDHYFFRGRFRAAVINFDMTMGCCEYKTPICPRPREAYDESLVFDRTEVEGFTSPVVFCADENLKKATLTLTDTYIKGGTYAEAHCSAMLKKLLVDILKAKDNMLNSRTRLAQKVLLYIHENAATIVDNKELAEKFGYHCVYLGEVFKSQLGITLHQAINEEKLRIASRMLMYTNSSVEEIATASGFSSRNQFCTVFKKNFGATPLAYRSKRAVYTI